MKLGFHMDRGVAVVSQAVLKYSEKYSAQTVKCYSMFTKERHDYFIIIIIFNF